jgi:hypothetical protein
MKNFKKVKKMPSIVRRPSSVVRRPPSAVRRPRPLFTYTHGTCLVF